MQSLLSYLSSSLDVVIKMFALGAVYGLGSCNGDGACATTTMTMSRLRYFTRDENQIHISHNTHTTSHKVVQVLICLLG